MDPTTGIILSLAGMLVLTLLTIGLTILIIKRLEIKMYGKPAAKPKKSSECNNSESNCSSA